MKAIAFLFFLSCLTTPACFAAEQFQSEQAAQQHCPDDTVVWLNLRSGVIHAKGQPWYGRTAAGAYVCRKETAQQGDSAASNAHGEIAWVKVTEDESMAVYAAPAAAAKKGGRVRISSLADLRQAAQLSDGKTFLSWKTQYEFDCKKTRSRILAASMHSGNMGGGEATNRIVYDTPDWEVIPPNSNGESLFKFACGKSS
ncbi:MAG: hypothetical protein HYZ46_01880 [Nitrosomonadales bacterium]|nr:hypothetical protein [Nitrosomonadales bacterium]